MIHHISNYLTPTGDLVLKEKELKCLPRSLIPISNQIIHLDLRNNHLKHLNSTLSSLTHLRSLDLRYNYLEILTEEISSLVHLKVLRIDNNYLISLPLELFSLVSLTILTVNRNSLYSLPVQIQNLANLLSLIVSSNNLTSLPAQICSLKKLKTLCIHGNDFTSIPSGIHELSDLVEFSLEWFRYSIPPLPRVLKNKLGESIIDSLKCLCEAESRRGSAEIDMVQFLTHFSESQFDIDRLDLRKRTLLHLAVLSGDNGVIKGLIKAGCDINQLDSDGYSAFVLSLKENNITAANILIEAGARLDIGAAGYGSALNLAVVKSDPNLIIKLLKQGLNPNSADFRGNTCMHLLLETFDKHKHRNTIIGNLLLDYGADYNLENSDKWAPVHLAAKEKQLFAIKWMNKHNKTLKLFKKLGFDFNKLGGPHGWSPLHIASHSGDYDTVESLISVGANPISKNYDGKTPKDTSRANLALFKYLSRLEKECSSIIQDQVIKPNPENKRLFDLNKPSDGYKVIYEYFKHNDRKELENLIEEIENPILKCDAIYLLSLFKQKKSSKVLYKAKKCKEMVIKSEVMHASNMIRDFENFGTQSMTTLKFNRQVTPQTSLPNLSELIEEETRVDTLLLV
jgi:ankyrin repeat protein